MQKLCFYLKVNRKGQSGNIKEAVAHNVSLDPLTLHHELTDKGEPLKLKLPSVPITGRLRMN